MKMPNTVTELVAKGTIQATKTIIPKTPPVTPSIQSTQMPINKVGVKPEHILIGLLAIGVLAFVIYRIRKKQEENSSFY